MRDIVFVVCSYNNDAGGYDIFEDVFATKELAIEYINHNDLIHPFDKIANPLKTPDDLIQEKIILGAK